MSRTRKSISIISAALIICMIFAVGVFAADVKPGDTAQVVISIAENPGISYLKIRVSYDSAVLTLTGAEDTGFLKGYTPGASLSLNPYASVWSYVTNTVGDGEIMTLTFNVSADAADGTYPVFIEVAGASNQTEEPVSVNVSASSVTVKHEHDWNDAAVTKPATCKETGIKTFTCAKCYETKTETIPVDPSNHADYGTEIKNDKAATCGTEGYTGDTCCIGCGAVISKGDVIPPTDEHIWDKGEVTKPATCKEDGEKTYTCTVCKTTKTEKIDKLTTHTWGEGQVTTEATYDREGVMTYTCTVCGETKTEPIPCTDIYNHFYIVCDDGRVGDTVTAKLMGKGIAGLTSLDLDISFDDEVLQFVSGEANTNLKAEPIDEHKEGYVGTSTCENPEQYEMLSPGELTYALYVDTQISAESDSAVLATYTFKAINPGNCEFYVEVRSAGLEGKNATNGYTGGLTWGAIEPVGELYVTMDCPKLFNGRSIHVSGTATPGIAVNVSGFKDDILCGDHIRADENGNWEGDLSLNYIFSNTTIKAGDTFNIHAGVSVGERSTGATADTVYVAPGDVNRDGDIMADDARLALRASAKLEELTDVQFLAADVDGNGQVLADDARQILRYSAKLQLTFPVTWKGVSDTV